MAWTKAKTQRTDTAMENIAVALTPKRCLRDLELLINSQQRRGYVDNEDYRKAIEDIESVRKWVMTYIVQESAVAME